MTETLKNRHKNNRPQSVTKRPPIFKKNYRRFYKNKISNQMTDANDIIILGSSHIAKESKNYLRLL